MSTARTQKQAFKPSPPLLHAYKGLLKAYQGHIQLDLNSEDIELTSDNQYFEKSAKKTLHDIQIAYTNGTLDKNAIRSHITAHLPDELKTENVLKDAYSYTFKRPGDLRNSQQESLDLLLKEIEKQSPGQYQVKENGNIHVISADPAVFSIIFEIINTAYNHFETGGQYSEKQAKRLVKDSYQNSYVSYDPRAERRRKRQKEDRKKQDRIITHHIDVLHECDGIDLVPLAHHLMLLNKTDAYPFFPFEEHHAFAKGALDENGIPCIHFYSPVYNNYDQDKNQKLKMLMARAIKNTARAFNENKDLAIDEKLVRTLMKKSWESWKGQEPLKRFMSDADLKKLSHDSLFCTIEDWLPMDMAGIARNTAINLDNEDHFLQLSQMLDELIEEGLLIKNKGIFKRPGVFEALALPVYVKSKDHEGNVYVTPVSWNEREYGPKPEIVISEEAQDKQPINLQDGVTISLKYEKGEVQDIKVVSVEKFLEQEEKAEKEEDEDKEPASITCDKQEAGQANPLGITDSGVSPVPSGLEERIPDDGQISGVIEEIRGKKVFKPAMASLRRFEIGAVEGLKHGDIVTAQLSKKDMTFQGIVGQHGNVNDLGGYSKLSALEAGIPLAFPDDIFKDSPDLSVPGISQHRKDYRDVPCITIDPVTAKDFDDAIYVERNKNGWKVMVFIADVSYYMKPGTNLYDEAYKRGNTTYLPDLTIPMLPEKLSNEICSLVPHEDRACMVTTMQINEEGLITSKQFERGLMRSVARLHYDQVQDALEGRPDELTAPLYHTHLEPAFEVYKALLKARENRGALNFNTPEQRVDVDEKGNYALSLEVQNESHGIIEELMIATNIAAIEYLLEKESDFIARVHGLPNEKTLKEFYDQLAEYGVIIPDETLPIESRVEKILKQAEENPNGDEIRRLMIRAQDKAKYRATLSEHFGLKLDAYTHKTSPIRRLTDYFIHCQLNEAANLKEGTRLAPELKKQFHEIADHLSKTERRSQAAENKASQRLQAAWVRSHFGETFEAAVTHVTARGVFIKVAGKDIKSLIPTKNLTKSASNDPNSDAYYKPGKTVEVTPTEADPVTGIIRFNIV